MVSGALLGCVLLLQSISATSAIAAQVPVKSATALSDIHKRVQLMYNQEVMPTVVLDLDTALFDTRYRTLAILREYAAEELLRVRPKAAAKLKPLTVDHIQADVSSILRTAGLEEEAVIHNGVVFWAERFYRDEYAQFDEPRPGAVEYVRALYSAGARIVYMSKRDIARQLVGTTEALRKAGFPVGLQGVELVLKRTMQMPLALYRRQLLAYLRQKKAVVAVLGSDPGDLNALHLGLADSAVVQVGTPLHASATALHSGIIKLGSF